MIIEKHWSYPFSHCPIFLGLKLRVWFRNRYPPAAFLDEPQENQPLLSQQNRVSFADPIVVDGLPEADGNIEAHEDPNQYQELPKESKETENCLVNAECQVHVADDFVLETVVI